MQARAPLRGGGKIWQVFSVEKKKINKSKSSQDWLATFQLISPLTVRGCQHFTVLTNTYRSKVTTT